MLSGSLVKYLKFFTIAVALGLLPVGAISGHVCGQESLDLELGGTGATTWSIGNIEPGDCGTETIELYNAGSDPGDVIIWVDNITQSDRDLDGAALADYLFFDVSCAGLSHNYALPARIYDLPQGTDDTNYIKIAGLGAGETIDLVWRWDFRDTGQPQNEAQGDSLSFDINYQLLPEGIFTPQPSGGGLAGTAPGTNKTYWLRIDVLGHLTVAKLDPLGAMLEACTVASPDGKSSLQFDAGTGISCPDGNVPVKIALRAQQNSPPVDDASRLIGPSYEIVGFTNSPFPYMVNFSLPVKLTLAYDPGLVNTDQVTVDFYTYDTSDGWTALHVPAGEKLVPGQVVTLVTQSSTFGIIATPLPTPAETTTSLPTATTSTTGPEVSSTPPTTIKSGGNPPGETSTTPTSPVTTPPAPAHFELSGLTLEPARVYPGDPVTVSVSLRNTGALRGNYTLHLAVDGVEAQSLNVVLQGGAETRTEFKLSLPEIGNYTISLGGLNAELVVLPPEAPTFRSDILLLTLCLAAPAGLLVYLFAIKFKVT